MTAGSRMLPLGRTNKDARVPPTGPYKKHMAEPTRPASPVEDSNARSSFSSVREDDSDLAQAFTISRTSSYSRALCNKVIDDDSSSGEMTEVEYLPPLTNPSSKLHGYFFPANSFKGWKEINVRGKLASKSFGDLQSLHLVWTPTKAPPKKDRKYEPGQAPIERLPMELLGKLDASSLWS